MTSLKKGKIWQRRFGSRAEKKPVIFLHPWCQDSEVIREAYKTVNLRQNQRSKRAHWACRQPTRLLQHPRGSEVQAFHNNLDRSYNNMVQDHPVWEQRFIKGPLWRFNRPIYRLRITTHDYGRTRRGYTEEKKENLTRVHWILQKVVVVVEAKMMGWSARCLRRGWGWTACLEKIWDLMEHVG